MSNTLVCAECGIAAADGAHQWHAYLDDDDQDVTFCPSCAAREFGSRPDANAEQGDRSD